MPEFLIAIYEDESKWAGAGPDVLPRVVSEHGEFMARNESALRGGNAIEGTDRAVAVRADGAEVAEGPYAHVAEPLCGYYLVEADDLDAAVELAKQVPAHFGGVEVRPVRTFE